MDCIFCKIVAGEIPSKKVYEDEKVYAFYDVAPAAPTHILIVPKVHCDNILKLEDPEVFTAMQKAVKKITAELGLDQSGFRLVVNTGKDGGQTVEHLHFHLLGGRTLEWPPG